MSQLSSSRVSPLLIFSAVSTFELEALCGWVFLSASPHDQLPNEAFYVVDFPETPPLFIKSECQRHAPVPLCCTAAEDRMLLRI